MGPDPRSELAVVIDFLKRYMTDRAQAEIQDLAEYQALYPGFEALIAEEFEALQAEGPVAAPAASALDRLGSAADPRISLDDAHANDPDDDPTGERYRDCGEVAHGGMGSIRRIWDRDLRRTIAMKMLGSPHHASTNDPQFLSRFLEEAQITGQLEHPGIVPVHELGVDKSARPYFTMPLVRGRSLREVIDRIDDPTDEWTLHRALDVVLRACEAIAFAHAKGVVHRDLKPSNIMVGRFGEVYVMDWGLARVLGREDRKNIRLRAGISESLSSLQTTRKDIGDDDPDSPLVTMDGDVIGTPAYMSPEQACGDVERVGTRSDVYSIGAMLYHVISGSRPYLADGQRASSRTVLACVLQGPPRPLAALGLDVPPELYAICEKAMARDPNDRYADVIELAADLRAFLELRVVRAYGGGAIAELRKWVRRNKALAVASAAAMITLLFGLGFSLVQMQRADAAAGAAETNFELASDAVDELVLIGGNELRNVPLVDGVRRQMLERALAFHMRFVEARSGALEQRERAARSWMQVAKIHRNLGDLESATSAIEQAITRLSALLADAPSERPALRAVLAGAFNERGQTERMQGEFDASLISYEHSSENYATAIAQEPRKVAYRTGNSRALYNRSAVLNWKRRHDEALLVADEVCATYAALVADNPEDLDAAHGHATAIDLRSECLRALGRFDDALAASLTSVQLHERVIEGGSDDRDVRWRSAYAFDRLARMLQRSEQYAQALEHAERALGLRRALVDGFPHVPSYRGDYASSLNTVGQILVNLSELDRAHDAFDESIRQSARTLAIVPDDHSSKVRLANQYNALFGLLERRGDHREYVRRTDEVAERALFAPPRTLYYTATRYATSVALVGRDDSLSAVEREQLIEQLARRTIELLDAALDAGHPNFALEARNFVAIRDRADFAAFAARLEARRSSDKRP